MKLNLNTITIKQAGDLDSKFRLASAAGYDGLELWVHEVAPSALGEADRREAAARYGVDATDEGDRVDAALALAREHDLEIAGLCPASNAAVRWHASLEPEVMDSLERTIDVCRALGASYLVLPVLGEGGTLEDTAENLATLAGLAAPQGVRLALEPVGHVAKCATLPEALRVLDASGAGDAAGLVVDAFHFFRAGQTLAELRTLLAGPLGVERIVTVHVNDAMDLPRSELYGHKHRVFPGSGIWDVAGFCRTLRDAGYDGLYATEILNEDYWARDPAEICTEAYTTSRRVAGAHRAEGSTS